MRSFLKLSSMLLHELQNNVSVTQLIEKANQDYPLYKFKTFEIVKISSILDNANNKAQADSEFKAYLSYLGKEEFDFFDVLKDFSNDILVRVDNKIKFKYEFTDIWRDYNRYADEDIVVASSVYFNDMKIGLDRERFDWPFCAEHNNHELEIILNRGMSENHFHLRGSSPFFYISWVCLMNDVCNKEFIKNINKIDSNRLNPTIGSIRDGTMTDYWIKAAAIRLYLYFELNKIPLIVDCITLPHDVVEKDVGEEAILRYNVKKGHDEKAILGCIVKKNHDKNVALRCIVKKDCVKKVISRYYINKYRGKKALLRFIFNKTGSGQEQNTSLSELYLLYINENKKELFVQRGIDAYYTELLKILNNTKSSSLNLYNINQLITYAKTLSNDSNTLDYAILRSTDIRYKNFSGERSLEYYALKSIYTYKNNYERISSMLYLYLVLRNRFHMELVQTNKRHGFYNFQEYQDRKDDFISWNYKDMEQILAIDTISSVLENDTMKYVELRITPPGDVTNGKKKINNYIKAINKAKKISNNNTVTKFFFTFHFIKLPYTKEVVEKELSQYRHYSLRSTLYKKAQTLMRIRDTDSNISKYILGIDACSDEMDCRPEVFGCIYRLLQHYEKLGTDLNKKQLRATYHVGEDNYDLLDGLRAIDEAIIFLDLRSGSRLGHATALGVSPHYSYSNNEISIPKDIFLDNIVWMREYIRKLNISVGKYSEIYNFVEIHFQRLFNDIYGKKILKNNIDGLQQSLIDSYYHSWLLRGDDPEFYRNLDDIDYPLIASEEYRRCNSIPEIKIARKDETAKLLVHLYHYDEDVKRNGFEIYTVRLEDYIIDAIGEIQKYMRKKLTLNGIGIETNPSSNVFIGAIRDYSDHHISKLYNNSLSKGSNDTQMNVSINTDDKSVFSTCLANEYAYLAHALEKLRDEEGNNLYTHFDIFKWIDEIRIMGNEQSFAFEGGNNQCQDI